ncbi:MAG: hypothetical protein U9R37_02210 [Campylobacterota bacterium]|nr:hypothetical protein [Campylobacterota bacterium]
MKTTTKLIVAGLLTTLFTTNMSANQIYNPEKIFLKKCQMCHALTKPQNKQEKMRMAAPPIAIAMRSVVIGVDAIEDPADEKELRKMSIAFLEDYLMSPSQDKGYCEDMSYKKFGTMPSLKGFITPEQISIVVPWVYENFAPQKDENGNYTVHSKRK